MAGESWGGEACSGTSLPQLVSIQFEFEDQDMWLARLYGREVGRLNPRNHEYSDGWLLQELVL
jgi:hypothetical protein